MNIPIPLNENSKKKYKKSKKSKAVKIQDEKQPKKVRTPKNAKKKGLDKHKFVTFQERSTELPKENLSNNSDIAMESKYTKYSLYSPSNQFGKKKNF